VGESNQSPMLSNHFSWDGSDGSIVGTCTPVFTVVYVYTYCRTACNTAAALGCWRHSGNPEKPSVKSMFQLECSYCPFAWC
jgi:hypothetical protein